MTTDDDDWRKDEGAGRGENYGISEGRQVTEGATGVDSSFVRYAIDRYPLIPDGLYGVSKNDYKWASDWCDPDYYARPPHQGPQGPEKGVTLDGDNEQYMRVRRGDDNPLPGFGVGLTFFHGYAIRDNHLPGNTVIRCAVGAAEVAK